MDGIQVFEKCVQEYDEWFDINRFAYDSEILALRKLIPQKGEGLEVGVGTGRFSVPLGIKIGVEPAIAMADLARKRGIQVYEAKAEELPFESESFDFVLMVTTICFLQDPMQAFKEANRILNPEGYIIIGMIDRDSPLGMVYESKKEHSRFYKYARFYSVSQVLEWLSGLEYGHIEVCQTIFKNPEDMTAIDVVKDGYGEGAFVVISSQKEAKT